MNQLDGQVTAIDCNGQMSLVDVKVGDDTCTAIVLETPDTAEYLRAGAQVTLMFKETEVSLAKNLSGLISLRNRFSATVCGIRQGAIMSAVELDYHGHRLTSVITTRAVERLQLAVGDVVEALVKANEMVISGEPHAL
jgi:molybdopterin-binding protein